MLNFNGHNFSTYISRHVVMATLLYKPVCLINLFILLDLKLLQTKHIPDIYDEGKHISV